MLVPISRIRTSPSGAFDPETVTVPVTVPCCADACRLVAARIVSAAPAIAESLQRPSVIFSFPPGRGRTKVVRNKPAFLRGTVVLRTHAPGVWSKRRRQQARNRFSNGNGHMFAERLLDSLHTARTCALGAATSHARTSHALSERTRISLCSQRSAIPLTFLSFAVTRCAFAGDSFGEESVGYNEPRSSARTDGVYARRR